MPHKTRFAAFAATVTLLTATILSGCTAPHGGAGNEAVTSAPEATPSASPESASAAPSESAAETQPEGSAAEYKRISAEEAREMMNGAEDYVLLDVRTDEEFAQQHIGGAVLIPDFEIADRAENELPDKDALILIYCRSGRRSALAAQELVAMGYINVYDFGGIIDWPYEVE